MPVNKSPQKPKADKDKQFDVIIGIIHDNREGLSKAVEKPTRFSFATEQEAVDFANKLKETK